MITDTEIETAPEPTTATLPSDFDLVRLFEGEHEMFGDERFLAMAGDSIDRRRFLALTARTSAAVAVGLGVLGGSDSAQAQGAATGFLYGVASGLSLIHI